MTKRTDHPFQYEGDLSKRYPRATLPHEGEVNLSERQQKAMQHYWQCRREADALLPKPKRPVFRPAAAKALEKVVKQLERKSPKKANKRKAKRK